MGKKLVSLVVMFVLVIALLGDSGEVNAEESNIVNMNEDIYEMDCMQPYLRIINEINEKYGAEMAVPTEAIIKETGLEKESIIKYYLAIDVDEFEDFLIDLYYDSLNNDNNEQADFPTPTSTTIKQKYIFTNGDCIYIDAVVYYANGANRYSTITKYGCQQAKTPYYAPTDLSYKYSDGQKYVDCTFKCYKYYSANLMCTTTPRYIKANFSANGGHCYEMGSTDIL